MVKGKVRIKNPTGLHLRPAGLFCKTAMQFDCRITVLKKTRHEDVIEIICEGTDEEDALGTMVQLVEDGLGE